MKTFLPSWLTSLPPLRWLEEALGAPAARTDVATELRASEERYRGIVETQEATVMRLDFDGRITFVNEFCCRFSGVPREQILGQSYAAWVHADDRDALLASLAALQHPPYRTRGLSRVVMPDGSFRWLEWEGAAILDANGVPVELQSIGRDVTARLATEEALRASLEDLRASEEKLRRLARHQVTMREEERKRLGFDLHDGVGQELVGIGILVEAIRRQLGPTSTTLSSEFDRVVRYLTHLGEHIRGLAGELRPLILHDLGLEGSLRSLADGVASETASVEVVVAASIPRLEEAIEVGVYRIAQEALLNAVRHARASRIVVTLELSHRTLRLEVRDEGCGFDPESRRQQAVGIVGMEERALALGGRLEVASIPDHGTTVRLECPCVERASAA